MNLDASHIGLRRLARQRILNPTFKHPVDVVSWLGVMQGQDYIGTKWAFGVRLPTATDAYIERAFVDQHVMRAWALRGTLFAVAPADIHWILGLIGPRLIKGNAGRYKQLELDESTLSRSTPIIVNALRDGQHLSRTELFAILESHGISTAGQRGVYMLQRAGLERLIVQAEVQRNVTTFYALPAGQTRPPDEAAAELARRYFISRGPATLADFIQWSGLTITESRAALDAVRPQLLEERIDGQSYWLSPDAIPSPAPSLHLLTGFDEFVLGYKDRSAVLDPQYTEAICPGSNGMFMPTIGSDGRIIGTWKRTLKKKTVEIALTPFRPLSPEERHALDEAAAHYGRYVGLQPVILP